MGKDLVEFIVKSLVDKPEEVSLNVVEGSKNTIIEVHVAEDDIGKIIGKMGRIAKSIRAILSAVSVKEGRKITLEIID